MHLFVLFASILGLGAGTLLAGPAWPVAALAATACLATVFSGAADRAVALARVPVAAGPSCRRS